MQFSDYVTRYCPGNVVLSIKHFSATVAHYQSIAIFLNGNDCSIIKIDIFKYSLLADAADMVAFSDIVFIF